MTPLPPETAAGLRQRLMIDLARGSSWRAALANARLMHPQASEALDELERLPEPAAGQGVLLQPPRGFTSEHLAGIVGWFEFHLLGAFSLVFTGALAQVVSRKVMPVLCQARGALAPGDAAVCTDTLGLLGLAAVLLAFALAVVTVIPMSRRVNVGRRLVYAGRLAGLGLTIGDAVELAFGRAAARALPADYLDADDARHAPAAQWLETVGTRILERPDVPLVRLVGWASHASAWVLGAYTAFIVYGTTFTLAGGVP